MRDNELTHNENNTFDQIAALYDQGRYTKAFEIAHDLSINGDYNAEKWLACMYLNGEGTERDAEKARHWFEEIQNVDGSGETDYYMGYICIVDSDYKKASTLYEQSVEKGYIPAYCELASLYRQGEGVAKDKNKAFDLYNIAANKGHTIALRYKSVMLLQGINGISGVLIGLPMYIYAVLKFIILSVIIKESMSIRF